MFWQTSEQWQQVLHRRDWQSVVSCRISDGSTNQSTGSASQPERRSHMHGAWLRMGWPPAGQNTNRSFIFLAADEKADYWLLPILFVVPAEMQEECLGQSPNPTIRTTQTCIWNHELWRHRAIRTEVQRLCVYFDLCGLILQMAGSGTTLKFVFLDDLWSTPLDFCPHWHPKNTRGGQHNLQHVQSVRWVSRMTRSDATVLNAISRGRECSRGTLQRSDQRNDPSRDSIWNKGVGLNSAISPLGIWWNAPCHDESVTIRTGLRTTSSRAVGSAEGDVDRRTDYPRRAVNDSTPATEYSQWLKENFEIAKRVAKESAETEQRRYVDNYNLRSHEKSFEVGDKVILLLRDSNFKLYSRWTGPGKIRRKVSEHSYDVELVDGTVRCLHANHLRKYVERIAAVGVVYDADEDFGDLEYLPSVPMVEAEIHERFRDFDLQHLDED